jgi:hypothetical protein
VVNDRRRTTEDELNAIKKEDVLNAIKKSSPQSAMFSGELKMLKSPANAYEKENMQ